MAKSDKKSGSKKKGPSVDQIVAAVNEAARAQVDAEAAARKAVAKAATKRSALAQLRATSAAAAARAKRAARELAVAQAAAKVASDEEKKATRKAEKAAAAKKAAQKAATKLADRTRAAREELDALPSAARGMARLGIEEPAEKTTSAPDGSDGPDGRDAVPDGDDLDDRSYRSNDSDRSDDSNAPVRSGDADAGDGDPSDADLGPGGSVEPDRSGSAGGSEAGGSDTRDLETVAPVASAVLVIPSAGSSVGAGAALESPTEAWTLVRLRLLARDRGVRGYSAMSKARLVEVLITPAE